jgi:hypothetical protein
MVTVVTVPLRAAGRARLPVEPAAIFARIWDDWALKLQIKFYYLDSLCDCRS